MKLQGSFVLPNTNAVHVCDIFFRHRAMFSTCPNKKSQKSKFLISYGIFGEYFRPLHKLVQAVDVLQIKDNAYNSIKVNLCKHYWYVSQFFFKSTFLDRARLNPNIFPQRHLPSLIIFDYFILLYPYAGTPDLLCYF